MLIIKIRQIRAQKANLKEVNKMSEILVVRSKIKDAAKGMNVASDFADALSKKVEEMISQAVDRAKENNRKTIQPKDL